MVARTAVPAAVPGTRVPTAVPTAALATQVPTAARTAVPMVARTAVPMVARTAARTVPPDREPHLPGPGGAAPPPGPPAVHEPRPAGLRRAVLVPATAADPRSGHRKRGPRRFLRRPARPRGCRRAALAPRAAHPLPADRQGRRRRRDQTIHRLGRRRSRDRRPGLLRGGAETVRRRQHRRSAGPAPAVAAADRVRRPVGRRSGSPDAGERLHHPAVLPWVQPALRRPRRLHPAGGRREALAHPFPRAARSAAQPALDRPRRRGGRRRGG